MRFYVSSFIRSLHKAIIDDEIDLYPVPTYKAGDKSYIKLLEAVSINQKCRYKDAAYEFIKILMSESCQSSQSHGNPTIHGIPLNKQAYEQMKINRLNAPAGMNIAKSNELGVMERFDGSKLPEQLMLEFDALVKNTIAGDIIDEEVYKLIDEEVEQYITDKKSAEQTAKSIDEKVSLFLNE